MLGVGVEIAGRGPRPVLVRGRRGFVELVEGAKVDLINEEAESSD